MTWRRAPTRAEQVLWSAATRDVRRLDPDATLDRPLSALQPFGAPPLVQPPQEPLPRVRMPGAVDGQTLDRLRRGGAAVEARIDLHGLDQNAAFAALMEFIEKSVRSGRRTVLVITGKGAASRGGGVLRRSVPQWLKASPLAAHILTIVPAHITHGGEGAIYVVLRRRR